ncbi:MAG: hypothetical protein JWQ41_1776, partial [Variovorax sp.]|nr:hypothetical protein [Variovorax sp.]
MPLARKICDGILIGIHCADQPVKNSSTYASGPAAPLTDAPALAFWCVFEAKIQSEA